jgi:fructose-specific component phosphotransferase system IIB-like protein
MIHELTRTEYFNNPDMVMADALANGVKGEPYQKIVGKGKKARVVTRYGAPNNGHLYEFGKRHWLQAIEKALADGVEIAPQVMAEYREYRQ